MPSWYNAAIIILALAGVLLVLVNTRWGAYLSDDSYYYVSPARDLLAGRGFNPSIAWAPLFALALAAVSTVGLETLTAARWLNAILFGVNIFLVGRIVLRMQAPAGFALLAAALVLLSDMLIEAHGWAMSEALSFTFLLLSLNSTLAYLHNEGRGDWWAAAITAALSVLTRYASIPLVVAISLTLFFFGPAKTRGRRALEAILLALASLLPIAAYWARNIVIAGRPVLYDRFVWLPLERDQLVWFLYHWLSLYIPGRLLRDREIIGGVLALALIVGAGIIVWRMIQKGRIQPENAYQPGRNRRFFLAAVSLLSSFVGLNMLMLYLARGFSRLYVFIPRYLEPMLLVTLILLSVLASWIWQASGSALRLGLASVIVLFLFYYAYRAFDFSRMVIRTGLGYSNVGWHNSETVAYLRHNPDLVDMVTTGDMGIYFWTGRLPRVISSFGSVEQLHLYLCEHDAPLLLMDQMPTEIYGIEQEDVTSTLQLEREFNDSKMYRCPGTNE